MQMMMFRRLANLIDYAERADGPPPTMLWPFMAWCTKGTWPVILLAALASGIAGFFEMASSIVLGWVVDAATDSTGSVFFIENLPLLIGGILFFMIARPVSFGISSLAQTYILQPNMLNLIMLRIHRWTMGQSVEFFENDFAGRIAQKEMQTATSATNVVIEFVHTIVFSIASVLGAMVIVAGLDPLLSLFVLAWLVAYIYFIKNFMPKMRKRSAAHADARAVVVGQVVDVVTNVKTVKLFANIRHEDNAILGAMKGYFERSLDRAEVMVLFRFLLLVLAGIMPIVLIGYSVVQWSNGLATVGQIAAAGAVGLRLAQMTGWVSFTLMNIYGSIGEVEDGVRTLSKSWNLNDDANARALNPNPTSITFDNVSFRYGQEKGGIENIDLSVKACQKIGIVGASGAGKSTLVNLVLRLYDVENGSIKIADQNIAKVTQDSLRASIGMVTQETAMFNRSAMDNIRYGRPESSDADVIEAAKRAEAHDFIVDLIDGKGRQGYQAHLGERGVKLSGGQRQRIALARAILKDAPILVLDEATSALDSEVEASIQTSLYEFMRGKTVLAIAHRLSTLSEMDRIIVMENGRIVEDGTHTTLLAQNGLYARYWNRQSGGFIGAQDAAE
jgi:ATP-binding cassette subfamily B protein